MSRESLYVVAWQSKISSAAGKGDRQMSREACDAECAKLNELFGKSAYHYSSRVDDPKHASRKIKQTTSQPV